MSNQGVGHSDIIFNWGYKLNLGFKFNHGFKFNPGF